MKKQILGIVTVLVIAVALISGKPSDTDKLWELYHKYYREDLPQKANAILDEIIDMAKANHLLFDLLHAYGEKSNTYNWLYNRDEFYVKYADFLEKELETQQKDTLVSGFIHFYLTNVYADALKHFNPSIWEYDETPEKMRFWPIKQFSDKIFTHARYLLENAAYFNKIITRKLPKILSPNYEFYPSLWDVFANKISNTLIASLLNSHFSTYFDNSLMANDTLLSSYNRFKHLKAALSPNNPAALIVKLYQTDLAFAARDTGCKRFTQIDYDRLTLFYSVASLKNKQKKFIDILETYLEQNKDKPCEIIYAYYLAKAYYNSSYKNARIKALEIAEKFYQKHPEDSLFAKNLTSLAKTIKQTKTLDAEIKEYIVPGKELLVSLNYLNVSQVKITAYRISSQQYIQLGNYIYNDWKLNEWAQEIIKKSSPVSTVTYHLPPNPDYFPKTTSLLLSPLKKGFYLISIQSDSISKYLFTQVNNIGALKMDENKPLLRFYSKTDGAPLKKLKIAEVTVDYRSNKIKFSNTSTMDFYNNSNNNNISYLLVINHKDSALFGTPYLYHFDHRPRPQTRTYIYTDRLTYRPGEKIMFAAVKVKGYKRKKEVVTSGEKALVILSSPFGKTLWETRITPDENGVIHGEYILPENLQPGNYLLGIAGGSKRIKVETYKLPKYKLDFDIADKKKALGDTIGIKGTITTYSGMPANGTKVICSVWKKVRPEVKFFWMNYFAPSKFFVQSDTVPANPDGSFRFDFPTEKDTTRQTYEVVIRTILPSGETEEKTKTFAIEPFPYSFRVVEPEIMVTDWDNTISIKKELNGETAEFPVKLTLYELKSPSTPWLENQLHADTTIYTPEQWYKNTRLYPYPKERPRILREVLSTTIKGDTFQLPGNIKPGYYQIVLEKTFQGTTRKTTRTFFVTTSQSAKTFGGTPLHIAIHDTKPVKGGEVKEVLLNSAANGMTVNVYLYDGEKLLHASILNLNGKQALYKIQIPDTVQYKISAIFISYFNGKLIKKHFTFEKYQPSIHLQITRINDKTTPGKQEKITLKVTDDNSKPVKATLIAGMTDLALEKFGKNHWEKSFGCYIPDIRAVAQPQKNSLTAYLRFPQVYRYSFTPGTGRVEGYASTPNYQIRSLERGLKTVSVHNYRKSLIQPLSAESEPVSETAKGAAPPPEHQPQSDQPRINFNPTAFFYPSISTKSNGTAEITYSVPDALTTWHLKVLAFTNDWRTDIEEKDIVSNKPLMIITDMPRFLRQNDKVVLPVTIANISQQSATAKLSINITDPQSGQTVTDTTISLTVKNGHSEKCEFTLIVPEQSYLLNYEVSATANNYTDKEIGYIPVLSDRTLLVQSLPFYMNRKGNQQLTFKEFKEGRQSKTIQDKSLTVEVTANPLWYAVMALPDIMTSDNRFVSDILNNLFTSVAVSYATTRYPEMEKMIKIMTKTHPSQESPFLSALQKNKELKQFSIESSPWLPEADKETLRAQKLKHIFDSNNCEYNIAYYSRQLLSFQASDGGWLWYRRSHYSDLASTLDVLETYGKLINKLGYTPSFAETKAIQSGLSYAAQKMLKTYENIKKYDKDYRNNDHLSATAIKYMYVKSMLEEYDNVRNDAFDYYLEQMKKFWPHKSFVNKAMIGMSLIKFASDEGIDGKIYNSLKEYAKYNNELGMYWPIKNSGYYFQTSTIIQQTTLIDFFKQEQAPVKELEAMEIFLLKHKQTNSWPSKIATREAIIALLSDSAKFALNSSVPVEIKLGQTDITQLAKENSLIIPGTGYFKYTLEAPAIKNDMYKISVTKHDNRNMAWGAVYWQYSEDISKINPAGDKIRITREIYKQVEKNGKKVYTQIKNARLQPGDKIKIRLVVASDREMQYICVRDFRPSAFEPVETQSGYDYYSWKGYYKVVKDECTEFYFRNFPKGTLSLEYEAYVKYKGVFNGGYSVAQSMYSPEFVSNTKGINVSVK